METFFQDLRYGVRMLRTSPGFTAVAALTLALGIGANTAVFSVIDAVLLKMIPVQNPAELAAVGDPSRIGSTSHGTPRVDLFSYPLYRELRDNNQVFSGLLGSANAGNLNVRTDNDANASDSATRTNGRVVTGNYFEVLGIKPLIGRTFTARDEDLRGANPVVVISYAYWKRQFNLDPGILGRTLTVNGYPLTIIGVTPPHFDGEITDVATDIFLPMSMQIQVMPGRPYLDDPNTSFIMLLGRLKPGISLAQAKENLNLVFRQSLTGNYGAKISQDDRKALSRPDTVIDVVSGGSGFSRLRRDFSRPLILLMCVVGMVLLIACVNVANLMLARASSRSKEIAVRLAIGARPLRLIRQLLTESVLLALIGGALALLIASWGANLLVQISFGKQTLRALNIHPDARMLAFTAAVCLLTGILFGIAPALRALGVPLAPTLKDGTRSTSTSAAGKWSLGKVLVAVQVALSLLVLFVAGLLVRTLRNLQDVDFGYERQHLVIARPDFFTAGYKAAQLPAISQQLVDRLKTLPGVVGVSVSENGLFSGTESADGIVVQGYKPTTDKDAVSYDDWVGADYFQVVGIPIILGRAIGPQDTATSARVAVINETMAKFYFPGINPIGRKFAIDDEGKREQWIEIVGISRDSRDHSVRDVVQRRFFLPYTQISLPDVEAHFELRVAGDPAAIVNSVRTVFRDFDPNVSLREVNTLKENVDDDLAQERLVAQLSSFFGGLALLLACIGLYGVMSYAVSGRTREIGVRMALGAQRRDVLWMVLREALILVAVGLCIGVPAALGSSRLLLTMLYALSGLDPLSMTVSVLLLLIVATFAGYIPARRATRVDPMVALRYE